MSIFDKIAGKNEAIDFSYDLEFIKEASERAYLKRWAIDTCVNHIARTMSQTKFNVENAEKTHLSLNTSSISVLIQMKVQRRFGRS